MTFADRSIDICTTSSSAINMHLMRRFIKIGFIVLLSAPLSALAAAFFSRTLEWATQGREEQPYFVFTLPIAGLLISSIYRNAKEKTRQGTRAIIDEIHSPTAESLPIATSWRIYFASTISHLCGASVGKEGGALQIGASIAQIVFRLVKTLFTIEEIRTFWICSVAASFAAAFGTPIAAAFFAVEFTNVGRISLAGLLPALLASLLGLQIGSWLHVSYYHFDPLPSHAIDLPTLLQFLGAGIFMALVARLFLLTLQKLHKLFDTIKNNYFKTFSAGLLLVVFYFLISHSRYMGLGSDVVQSSFLQEAPWFDFLGKIFATGISLAGGFVGGEIAPLFVIGSLSGSVIFKFTSLSLATCAAIGLASMFAAGTNAIVASLFLALELFSTESFGFLAVAIVTAYTFSSLRGVYQNQKFELSKHFEDL